MSNMSYCRFQNTRRDFADCRDALLSMIDGVDEVGEPAQPLSREELQAAHLLIADAIELVVQLAETANLDLDHPFAASMAADWLEARNDELKNDAAED